MNGPNLILLAGPNGAGKTTASSDLLAGALGVHHFVNADEIAVQLGGEHTAIAAGRIMLERLRDLTDQRANVAFETTLATRSFAPWIRRLKNSGYSFNLFYFWLPTPEMAIERVRLRKVLGGHSVPEVDIRRRYHRGLQNFFQIYRPLATAWEFYDNTRYDPRLIAAGDPEEVSDQALWSRIKKEADRGDSE
ncbi:MAG TPA: zeta toxin family protein [Bryobacteraceae bacterium]|nr:zeta toxin family protein [Bryobacteraceae bacterium]